MTFLDDDAKVELLLGKLNKLFNAIYYKYKDLMYDYKKFLGVTFEFGRKKAQEKIADKKKSGVGYRHKDSSKDEKATDKKDGTSTKTIIGIVIAVVGLMIYEFYFKKKNNQRNNENSNIQTDVEELSDDNYNNYNYRNGRGFPQERYQNNNQPRPVEYQNNNRLYYIPGGNNNPTYQGNNEYRRVN